MSPQCSSTHALFSQIRHLHWSLSHTHTKTMFQRQKERQSRIQNTNSTSIPEKEVLWHCMFNYAVLLWLFFFCPLHSTVAERHCLCSASLLAPRRTAQHLGRLRTQLSIAAGPPPPKAGSCDHDRVGCAAGLVQLGIAEGEQERSTALIWLFLLLNLSDWGVLLRNKTISLEKEQWEKRKCWGGLPRLLLLRKWLDTGLSDWWWMAAFASLLCLYRWHTYII